VTQGSTGEVDLKLIRATSLLDTDPQAAARLASEILAAAPAHSAALLLMATACRSIGDAAEACAVLERLAAEQPGSAVIQLELARANRAAGRSEPALGALQRALSIEPDLAEAWAELSSELAAAGNLRGADVAYARYSRLAPDAPWLAEPAAALAENRMGSAEQLLKRHLSQSPGDVQAMRMLALVVARRDGFAEAELLLHEALRLAPGFAAARYDLGQLWMTQQKPAHMPALIDRLLALEPANRDYRNLQAAFLSFIGQHDRSLDILAALIAESPQNPSAWVNYGHELRAAGRQAESVEAYRRAIELAPTGGAAYWSLANLKTFRFGEAEIAAMRDLLKSPDLPLYDRTTLEFALAKALEDQARYAESFEHYATGNSLRQQSMTYDPASLVAHVQRCKQVFTLEFFAARAGWGLQAADPIFIVGLPRSGSTLQEQILASHSQVEGTRELADIAAIARELGGIRDGLDPFAYVKSLDKLDRSRLNALAQRYLDDTRIFRPRGLPRFIDKTPNNFLHIGLIQLMFPRASIIDARRNPMACCFSCFKQYFGQGQAFTYDLARLGGYYRNYVELLAHFDSVLPGRVHRVVYEQVVADLPQQVRQVLEYCGLPFEEACLHFYENRRVVQTASSEQVRRPIFSEGLNQWRHFEPWLGPLKEALGDLV
jgi:tetratricopeptide (TPR) repeat protein